MQQAEVPWGGRLPLLYSPLPATPGRFLSLAHHAGAVWTTAPWSAAVLATCRPDGYCRLAELKYLADNNDPPLRSGWEDLSAGMVSCKLLVMWKVWWWPRWSTLPYPEFRVLDPDPHSFDQYSVPPLHDDRWDEPVWYSTYFPFHVRAVAEEAAHVPCLCSLALWLLFVW